VVKLEVLLFGGCVNSPHGPYGLSSSFKKSLREIADFKEPKSAPAGDKMGDPMKRSTVVVFSTITVVPMLVIMVVIGGYWWSNFGPFRPKAVSRTAVFLRAPATGGPSGPRGVWLVCWQSSGENRCRFSEKDGATIFEGVFIPYGRKEAIPTDLLKIDTSKTKYADPEGVWINDLLVPMVYLQNGEVLILAQYYEKGALILNRKRRGEQ